MKWLLCLAVLIGEPSLPAEQVVYSLNFAAQPEGDAMPWLCQHGFACKLNCQSLHPRFEKGALALTTDKAEAGLFCHELDKGKEVHGAKRLRIVWGVKRFPMGADWDHGVNRLALAVMVSFGHDKLSSGLPFGVLAEPYFISAFIGQHEKEGKVYVGSLWKKGGRYVCVRPRDPAEAVTELEIDDLFRKLFGKSSTPPVTAIGFQMNAKDTRGGAAAFIKRIDLLAD